MWRGFCTIRVERVCLVFFLYFLHGMARDDLISSSTPPKFPATSTIKPKAAINIFESEEVFLGELSYQAILRRGLSKCGAVIVGPRTILTSANCVARSRVPSDYTVMAGLVNLDWPHVTMPNTQKLEVKEIVIHPLYTPLSPDNDLAMVHVHEPGFVFNKYVQSIEIHELDEFMPPMDITPSTILTASGWTLSNLDRGSQILQKVSLPMLTNPECQFIFEQSPLVENQVKDWMLCTGILWPDICSGDFGCFVTMNHTTRGNILVGIISTFGREDPCADDEEGVDWWPRVFTRVKKFTGWLQIEEDKFKAKNSYSTIMDSCGSFAILNRNQTRRLTYRNPHSPDTEEICVWIFLATKTGPIGYTLKSYHVKDNTLNKEWRLMYSPVPLFWLSFQGWPFKHSSSIPLSFFVKWHLGKRETLVETLEILTLVSSGRDNFTMDVSSVGNFGVDKRHKYDVITLEPQTLGLTETFSFPSYFTPTIFNASASKNCEPPVTQYPNNLNEYIIIKAKPGTRIRLSIVFLHLEPYHDHLDVYAFVKAENRFWHRRKLSGREVDVSELNFVGGLNEPFLLHFNSDHSVQGEGFVFNYSMI